MSSEKNQYFYYYDEINDDFANNGIKTKPLPDDYEYFPKNIWYRIGYPFVHFFLTLFFMGVNAVTDGYRMKNSKILKHNGKKGYFVFANHTTWIGDAVVMPALEFPNSVFTVVHPDAVSIPGTSIAIRMIGATPRPESHKHFVRFIRAIERMYNSGYPVVIYPEAHIWPKYNKIRPFPDVSFGLPVKLGAPCYVKTTVYTKKKNGHTYPTVYFDGPIIPDSTIPIKDAQKKLRDEVYNTMCMRAKNSELDERFHYIKVNSPEEVRTEKR